MKRLYDYEAILRFIILYKFNNDGLSPAYREIMKSLRIKSTSTTARILKVLEVEGKITLTPRGIMVDGGSWRWRRP